MREEDLKNLHTVREMVAQRKKRLRTIQVLMPALSGVITMLGVGAGVWFISRNWRLNPQQHILWTVGLGLAAGLLDYFFMLWGGRRAVEKHLPKETDK